jgi:hypothetical protein
VRVVFQFEICAVKGYLDVRPLRVLVGPFCSEVVHPPHVFLALPLVVVVVVRLDAGFAFEVE